MANAENAAAWICVQEQISCAVDLSFVLGSLAFLACSRRDHRLLDAASSRLKYIVVLLSAALSIANFSALLSEHRHQFLARPLTFVLFGIRGLSWIMISILISVLSKGAVLVFLSCWGASKFLSSLIALVLIEQQEIWPDGALTILKLVTSCLLIIYTISTSRRRLAASYNEPLLGNRKEQQYEELSPLREPGFFKRAFFIWLNPLLALGHKKVLELNDIPPIPEVDGTSENYSRFLREWESQEQPTILGTLARCHFKDIVTTGIFALLKSVTITCTPVLLQYFIRFSAKPRQSSNEGFILVAVLFASKFLENMSQRHWLFGVRRIGIRLRSSLVAAIYEKELKLSHEARQRHSTGEITSYISVDTFRLGEYMWWLHQVWTCPLQIVIALGILVHTVGWATLAGVLVIVVTAIVQVPLAKAQQKGHYNLMVAQDERLRTTSAILSNMKIVKLQAWEEMFRARVSKLRKEEFGWLSEVKNRWTVNNLSFWVSPIITASIVFAACIPLGVTLDATILFTVLATFRVMQEPVRFIPEVLTATIQAQVSLERLSKFFYDKELQNGAVDSIPEVAAEDDWAVSIENGSWTWDNHVKATVSNINLQVRRPELVAVCGRVGSGKSTLLLSILGETQKLSGKVTVRGEVAYVAQTAWIQSGTVRDNILFGLPLEESRYQKTLKACCLREDLTYFSHGDLTEIGERGLNLSGGQKQRIQLARALYADADVYLLDDPFSALDAHTASTLFKEYILGALGEKTVILVTHQVDFLASVKTVLVMDGGRIVDDAAITVRHVVDAQAYHQAGHVSEGLQRSESVAIPTPVQSYCQLTQEEERENDGLGLEPLKKYVQTSRSQLLLLGLVVSYATFICATSLSNYWLAVQVSNPATGPVKLIGVFAAISFASTGLIYLRSKYMVEAGLKASQAFFCKINESLFQAPLAFFDSTPLGRILSRLSSDMSLLDIDVPTAVGFTCSAIVDMVGVLVMVSLVTWQVLFVAIPIMVMLLLLERYYLATARELVKINGVTKAPLLNKTGETVNGAVTIRAFRKESQFKNNNMRLIDADAAASFHTFAAFEWIAMWVELLGTTVLSAAALLLVLFRRQTTPGLTGLSLSYALSLNSAQVLFVQYFSNMANYIVSAERISQYVHLPREAPRVIDSDPPASAWPDKGRVELQNLQIRYRENSPLVLKGVSCIFPEGNRIGLVGRTGSGKTTLISALFRLVEPAGGRIIIDGVDITTVGLLNLRSSLGVIPQEAFLFRGTVRSNLDPGGIYSDANIWQALRDCRLSEVIDRLEAPVSEDGENWSAGQKQLFCLARVLLKRCKILVLDEATASIDTLTDEIIQNVIRKEFKSCTVLTVAHRIPTVLDSNMILGLHKGHMVEYGPPSSLLLNANSLFAKLVAEYAAK